MKTEELEYRLLYSMVVAGKSATFATGALRVFFWNCSHLSPFQVVRDRIKAGGLDQTLRVARTGNYGKLSRGFRELVAAGFDLATVTAEQLEAIHGIGPKTSRFFILWTRPRAVHAALDTHVLKWLRAVGYDAPKSTPSPTRYAPLERAFIKEASARRMTPRQLDAAIWDWCSSGKHAGGEWPKKLQRVATP